jgi:lysophospholipase L1-like esterase
MSMKRAAIVATIALLAASPALAQVDLSRYVALGDSLTAGFAANGLTEYYQQGSYPALVAQQALSLPFEQPIISDPGIPIVLELANLAPTLVPAGDAPGMPTNATLEGPYNNLGIPGSTLNDMINTTGNIQNFLAGNTDNLFHDLILRDGQNPALFQAIGQDPTFVTVWIGNNDVLSAVLAATPVEGLTMTPVDIFGQLYAQAIGALAQNTSADILLLNLPDATVIPFVTTIDPFLTLPDGTQVPLIGSNGPLPADAYVTLGASSLLAQGIGVPTELGGTGQPLPEDLQIVGGEVIPGVVLRPAEIDVINQRIADFNQVIADVAASSGAHVLDINAIFDEIARDEWVFGAFGLTTDFLTGGIFSYDGVHPQRIGYGVIAAEIINYLNESMGANIEQVDMFDIMCGGGDCSAGSGSGDGTILSNPAAVYTAEAHQRLMEIFPVDLDVYYGRKGTRSGTVAMP